MIKKYKIHPLFLVLFFLPLLVSAQDIHFSQYYNSPLTINPALSGITRGDIRIIGTYRSQWSSALSPYSTFHGAADWKYFNPKRTKGFFSAGVTFNYDDAGDSNLRTTNFGISGAYTLAIGEENFLTFGVMTGFGQRAFDLNNLTWDNQFNGDVFDPNRDSREQFDRTSFFYPDFNLGINWHGQQKDTRSRLNVGVAAFHVNRPDQSFIKSDDVNLPVRWSLYFLPVIQITEKIDLLGYGTAQIQGPDFEAIGGGAGRFHLNTNRAREMAIQLGLSYRFNSIGDAIIPGIELHYQVWRVGFTYDVNISGFSEATNRNGGPEINVRYLIQKIRPLKVFKNCPLI
ncbi:MAG: PorP/SprF family type IX secretion system membrane protein [Saprospiraceae bacterium]|nr:PorP/SprF family type IX secretion system membrane protein [Saprospiraceae bacterium]